MQVLVTGANGHIGSNLVPLLLQAGHRVVPFVREKADTRGLDGLGLVYARGDVRDRAGLMKAAEGCDAIIHLAAVFSLTNDPTVVMAPALEGARNVVEVAQAHRIKRVVYTSSTTAVGRTREPQKLDESSWSDESVSPYAIAKRDSEREATRLAAELGVDLIILNPCMILGRGDWRMTPSSAMISSWLNRSSQTVNGGSSLVDVRDVALAHLRALTLGAPGERHILCSACPTHRELGHRLKELFGVGPMHLSVPRWLLIPASALIESTHRLLGKEPPFTRSQIQEWGNRFNWFDGSKAARVFGIAYRPLDELLIDAVRWLAHRGAFAPKLNERLAAQFPPDPSWAAAASTRAAA